MSSTPAKRAASDVGTSDPKRSKTGKAKGDKGLSPEQELQMSLLNSDPKLKAHFAETVIKNRPDGVSPKSMARQFWASRGHLLRAHAIQREQQRAERYALSEKRLGPPKEGKVDVIMDQRQISDIFRQHPIVRKAFDELVPGRIKTPNDFWSRFWSSHLCCAIKGERPNPELTKKDADLDRYLTQFNSTRQEAEEARLAAKQSGQDEEGVAPDEQMIPRFIDLEGNEQNHSQRKGNAPDIMMRPKETREGTIRILNTMSERILAASTPADDISAPKDSRASKGKQHNPAGMDEATYNQLRLRDLQADDTDDRVKLNIRDPNQIHASATSSSADCNANVSADAKTYLRIDPAKAVSVLRKDIASATTSLNLEAAIGFIEESDQDSDDDEKGADGDSKKAQVGSHGALAAASKQVTRLLEQQQHMLGPSEEEKNPIQAALTHATAQNLLQVHHTTVEFLHFFWALLLSIPAGQSASSNASAAKELPALLESLSNSLARVTSVAQEAERERRSRLAALQQEAHEATQRSEGRRRVTVKEEQAGPGEDEVKALLGPAVLAVQAARARFEALDLGR